MKIVFVFAFLFVLAIGAKAGEERWEDEPLTQTQDIPAEDDTFVDA